MHSRDMTRLLATLVACTALIAGCGSDDGSATGGETAAGAAEMGGTGGEAAGGEGEAAAGGEAVAAKPPRGSRVTLRDSQFGPVLFDGRNRALYLFTRDPRRKTRCYGDCAVAWPPFYAKGRPRAGRGVDRDLLGTIERRDGRRQVTYNGQALYFYVDDPRGQVLCNDIVEFGGTWYAVDSKGNPPA
jgi:predicted lipoprotein with Yx(FWY)xxD motif